MGTHALHNDNLSQAVYTLEIDINLLELNPAYPQNPQTLGEKIRKARMNRGLLIRELAYQLGVTADTVINWEKRGMKPSRRYLEKVNVFLEG